MGMYSKILDLFYKKSPTKRIVIFTGKSLSEAFIIASINPQYDDRLFIELQVQYKKTYNFSTCCVLQLFVFVL